jgi:hypothetical protein
MDLDTVSDELYALPRDEFVAARDERAREARSDGDRKLATEIGRLRKPSTAAWLANLLAREQPAEIDGLVELGDALRRAHSELDGEALRRLSGQRHELVAALAGQARRLGRSAGQPVSEGVSRELEDTFTAALGDPDAARALAAGRLTSALQPGASDGGGWPSGGGEQAGRQRGGDRAARREREEPDRQEEPDRRSQGTQRQRRQRDRLQRDLDAARRAASEAESSLRDAADSLRRAERAEEDAKAAVADRRAELQAAERAADEAADDNAAARRRHDAADRQAREAQQRADDLDRRLDRLDDG